jgi:hypothetical protein
MIRRCRLLLNEEVMGGRARAGDVEEGGVAPNNQGATSSNASDPDANGTHVSGLTVGRGATVAQVTVLPPQR